MKFAVLGATGQTGQLFIKQALEKGHEVVAIVRTPSKITATDDKLTVVEGDVFSPESLKSHSVGCDAFVSCLGFSLREKPVVGYMNATKAMVGAMKENGFRRMALCHSWYTEESSRSQAPFFLRYTLLKLIGPVLNNMREAEVYLESEASNVDYTVVLPGGLSNAESTGAEFLVKEGSFAVVEAKMQIPRADVARFMLRALENGEHKGKIVAIGI